MQSIRKASIDIGWLAITYDLAELDLMRADYRMSKVEGVNAANFWHVLSVLVNQKRKQS